MNGQRRASRLRWVRQRAPAADCAMSEIMEREVFDLGGFASLAEGVFKLEFVDRLSVNRKDKPSTLGTRRRFVSRHWGREWRRVMDRN